MQFFVMKAPKPDSAADYAGRIDVLKADGTQRGPADKCPACGKFITMLKWLPPFRIEIETWGRAWGDVARTGDDLVVSERFRNWFQESRLQGLELFEPVEVVKVIHRRGRIRAPRPEYFKCSIPRSSATIDQAASGYEWAEPETWCPTCQRDGILKGWRRVVVQEETWDGKDIFFPTGPNELVVTDKFRESFTRNGLLGAVFTRADSDAAGHDFYPWEKAGADS